MESVLEAPSIAAKPLVGMGQILMAPDPTILTSVLGSCVGVVLFHNRKRMAAMAHVVLPSSNGRPGTPGKFADTAIPEMLRLFAEAGVENTGLVAKIAGGANMFGNVAGPLQIGEQNIVACKHVLEQYRIPIQNEHLGGKHGRRVNLNCGTGEFVIEIAGHPAISI